MENYFQAEGFNLDKVLDEFEQNEGELAPAESSLAKRYICTSLLCITNILVLPVFPVLLSDGRCLSIPITFGSYFSRTGMLARLGEARFNKNMCGRRQ